VEKRASAWSEIVEARCHNTFLFSPTHSRILTAHPPTAGFAFHLRRLAANSRAIPVHHDGLPTTSGRRHDPAIPLVFVPGF